MRVQFRRLIVNSVDKAVPFDGATTNCPAVGGTCVVKLNYCMFTEVGYCTWVIDTVSWYDVLKLNPPARTVILAFVRRYLHINLRTYYVGDKLPSVSKMRII